MDKKIAGLLGAVAAVGVVSSAAIASPLPENSAPQTYRDLLNPVSNPIPTLRADNARLGEQQVAETVVIKKKGHRHHHHHHHHHNYHG